MFHRIGPAALKPGLNNTIEFCKLLNNPQNNFKSIHIAGTNGKGSSSHMLAAVLQAAGYKTGLYTSPHLKSFTERIKINGEQINEKYVVDFIAENKIHIDKIKPSFFEVTVGMAFQYFSDSKVDIAIIETGLGGRLDSTNIIIPLVSLITNISMDHQAILGDSLTQIASEKAGIIKSTIPVVISETQSDVEDVFNNTAKKLNAKILFGDKKYIADNIIQNASGLCFDIYNNGKLQFKNLNLDLRGNYQIKNIAGVLAVLEILNFNNYKISEQDIKTGLAQVSKLTGLKGRWQILKNNPLVMCDTGHNEAGINLIVEQLKSIKFEKLYWVFGVVNDKKIDAILKLLPKSAYYFFCKAAIPRALDAFLLKEKADEFSLQGEVIENVNEAYQSAISLSKANDLIMIGGSTFVVAEINDL